MGGPEGRFWKLFDALSLERALSLEEATTYEKPVKTNGFYRFFSCPLLRARFENQLKINRRRFANASRDRSFAKGASFDVGGRKMAPKSPQGRLGRPPGADFGALRGFLGALRGTLGALLERSGVLWDRSCGGLGALMGRSWALLSALDASGRSLGDLGSILALPRSILELDFGSETLKLGAI